MALVAATKIITQLGLVPHPEGGYFRELHRGAETVVHSDGRIRSSGTLIYFLLEVGSVSRWHVVQSDEYWVHVDGAPLALHQAGPNSYFRAHLGPPSQGLSGATVVPAGTWQAAASLGEAGQWSLVSCAVAPGFDFTDFALFDPAEPSHEFLRQVAGEAGDTFFGE
ncbi:MAG: cupin domain-containing protein [Actinomycetia bacterium]|nr:cupin domain-containing protein [Actinomycetes bacterium]